YLAPLPFLDEMSAAFSALPYKASPHGGTKSMSSTEEQAEVVRASDSMHPPWLLSLCKLEVHPTETILTLEEAPVAIPALKGD
ncbi:Zinc Finger Ccch Domain-Containing Protein 6, partial [Manis pentadactyla]